LTPLQQRLLDLLYRDQVRHGPFSVPAPALVCRGREEQ
jgi:hypothetical protein